MAILGAAVSVTVRVRRFRVKADHPLARSPADTHRRAARKHLEVAQHLDRQSGDVVEAGDALAVDQDQGLLGLLAELDFDFAEELVDGAYAVAGDALLIELALGADVTEQRRRGDDDVLRARIDRSLGCAGLGCRRNVWIGAERGTSEKQRGGAQGTNRHQNLAPGKKAPPVLRGGAVLS